MRMQVALGVLGSLLIASPAWAQTEEIQNQIDKKLESMRKKQAVALQELLAQALKNNPDVRVAESKVREAEAELYRARVNVLNRVVMQRNEIAAAKFMADEATARYEREVKLSQRGAVAERDIRAARAAMMKFRADLATKEAELDLLIGKHQGKAAEFLRNINVEKPPAAGPPPPEDPLSQPAAVSDAIREKILKALDASYCSGPKVLVMPASEVLEILRKHTKGINILSKLPNEDVEARLNFKESIPLGALFQWAEDQFGWRFIVRDYGIVAVDRSAVPPGRCC